MNRRKFFGKMIGGAVAAKVATKLQPLEATHPAEAPAPEPVVRRVGNSKFRLVVNDGAGPRRYDVTHVVISDSLQLKTTVIEPPAPMMYSGFAHAVLPPTESSGLRITGLPTFEQYMVFEAVDGYNFVAGDSVNLTYDGEELFAGVIVSTIYHDQTATLTGSSGSGRYSVECLDWPTWHAHRHTGYRTQQPYIKINHDLTDEQAKLIVDKLRNNMQKGTVLSR